MKASFRSVLLGLCTLTGLGACVATPSMAADATKYESLRDDRIRRQHLDDGGDQSDLRDDQDEGLQRSCRLAHHQSARGDAQTQVQQINAAVRAASTL